MKEDILFSRSGEVTTENHFSLLEDTQDNMKQEPSEGRKKPEETYSGVFSDNYMCHDRGNTLHDTYDNFVDYDKFVKFNNDYMYKNKYNFCSGYFPDFIFLDKNSFNDMYNMSNFPRYYPYVLNGNYLKQLSNFKSKYNNNYFSKMSFTHRLSKQIDWNNECNNNNYKPIPFKDSF